MTADRKETISRMTELVDVIESLDASLRKTVVEGRREAIEMARKDLSDTQKGLLFARMEFLDAAEKAAESMAKNLEMLKKEIME